MNEQKNQKNAKPARKLDKKALSRLVHVLFSYYPKGVPFCILCIVVSAVIAVVPAVFLEKVTNTISSCIEAATPWETAVTMIVPKVLALVAFYVLSIIATIIETQIAAVITQGFLSKMRKSMFDKMQDLPIRFFDRKKAGDIMSFYTNDIDTLRQLISQSLPTVIRAGTIVIGVFCLMVYYSLWLSLILVCGVIAMLMVSGKLGGGSAKFFVKLQSSVGKQEGYVQEMMNGQKVVKVFNHEQKSAEGFDALNEELYQNAYRANAYANMLGPIIMNIGNVLYVIVAIAGCAFLAAGVPNASVQSIFQGVTCIDIGIVVSYMSMTKQFTGNINQVAQQINSIVMAMAGANRIFSLMDQEPETDNGYVTLVNAEVDSDGTVREVEQRTGRWAWKHPHSETGMVTYTLLQGDVRLTDVDFSYVEGKQILHDVSVYAEPGQKVAFVGATGAGKTTITNLINRFYDIEDGKIRYDGININKIKKADLRRSLGIVLQDTNLFTGSVMDNIRYGKLDATDEECIAAAKLAGADDFITRLPEGYGTMLYANGSNLSQGQRQLLSIARAAVADPPVMILDEATSSIDTRTEAIVQRGMDKLMEGRTVFVIAHRLSTVKNADVIMVLDHGRIIERGNHEKLIAERGVYYQLYTGAFELE